MQFVTIANKQLNTRLILGAEGAIKGQGGKVRLYVDQRAGGFLSGIEDVKYTEAKTIPASGGTPARDHLATIELTGALATQFRDEWNKIMQPASMSASQ